MAAETPSDEALDLLIVGAGPTGLLCSILASSLGLRHRVLERRDGLHDQPSAHVLKTHSMEVLRRLGMDARIHALGTPQAAQRWVTWCSSVAGPVYGRIDLDGKKGKVPRFLDVSPSWPANLPQTRLEPILLEQARTVANNDRIAEFGQQVEGLTQDESGVVATVCDRASGARRSVRAAYVIGADGAGSTVRRSVGIAMEGPPVLGRFLTVHIRSDFRAAIGEWLGLLAFIIAPGLQGTFIVHEPVGSQVFNTPISGDRPLEDYTKEECAALVRAGFGSDHPFEILGIGQWVMSAQIAEHYRQGRVFLVGDSAHRFPPTGGLGLNTGIEDADNLLWKLAAVIRGRAGPALLDSYETECRPTARRNCDRSVLNSRRKREVEELVGLHDETRSFEASLAELFGPDGASRRAAVQASIQDQLEHFALLHVEMAAVHRQGAFVPSEQPPPTPLPAVEGYQPSLLPGGAVPHVWVAAGRSTLDCLGEDRMTLFVDPAELKAWSAMAAELPAGMMSVAVVAVHADARACERVDWRAYCGGRAVAVLVRPDGRIAWVDWTRDATSGARLAQAMAQVLSTAVSATA